jgi:hypothetical protein
VGMLSLSVPIVLIASITSVAQTAEPQKAPRSQIVEQLSVRGNRRLPEADIVSGPRTR